MHVTTFKQPEVIFLFILFKGGGKKMKLCLTNNHGEEVSMMIKKVFNEDWLLGGGGWHRGSLEGIFT